ncbi:MAG: WXG100 family type VII secretion target [Micromonosporaceae bacterium]|nr:WXG100 family type VII secretion target [Micromonosporaceae bacterium]
MTINPLVVPRLDQPSDIWAGIWIAEDIELIVQGVRTGNWVDTSIGSLAAGLDGLALVTDPFGSGLQYIAASLMEQFGPLREVLDWLAGDPGQIAGHAMTWRNVSAALATQHQDLTASLSQVATWQGSAADAYRNWAQAQHNAVAGLSAAAGGIAEITECAGLVVATVRVLVRDLIAMAFSRAVVYVTEEVLSLGYATPLVAVQVSTLVLQCAARISRLLHGLVNSLERLFQAAGRLARHVDELRGILSRLDRSASPGGGGSGVGGTSGGGSPSIGGSGGYTTPPYGSPAWLARQDQLARDPAHGGVIKPKGLREAEVGLILEARGDLPGPITRAPQTIDPHTGDTIDHGDFLDATGQAWDVKQPTDIFPPTAPNAGQPMPPGLPGRYDGPGFERAVADQLAAGQNVILDTTYLSDAARADLRARVASHPEWDGRVIFL